MMQIHEESLISLAKFNGYIHTNQERAVENVILNSKTHQFYYTIMMIATILALIRASEQSKLLEQLLLLVPYIRNSEDEKKNIMKREESRVDFQF